MSYPKDTERSLRAYLANLPTPDGADVDGKILADALTAMQRAKNQYATHTSRMTWRTIMTSRMSKLAVAGLAIAAVLSLSVFDSFTRPAWAIEQAIEAVKEYRAIHMVGTIPGRTFESWMRSNKSMTQTQDVVARDSNGGVAWVKNGSTYLYDPGQNTVSCENAITQGFSQWPGPEFLEMFAKAKGAEVLHGKDPATGRDRVTLMCSLVDVDGPQSWIVEFDVASKLPVSFKCWPNLDQSGTPAFDATKITYYKDLSDSLFDVHIPGHPAYVEKPLTIPEENIDLLSNPEDGMATEGLTTQEAAERVVQASYQAIIRGDLAGLRKLCPLCKNFDDEMLRAVILKTGKPSRIVELIKIEPICKTGESKLGSLVAIPVVLKHPDGTKSEEKLIVQFRQLGDKSSCVVHGPYGVSRDIE
jgi:hypothetical protein